MGTPLATLHMLVRESLLVIKPISFSGLSLREWGAHENFLTEITIEFDVCELEPLELCGRGSHAPAALFPLFDFAGMVHLNEFLFWGICRATCPCISPLAS